MTLPFHIVNVHIKTYHNIVRLLAVTAFAVTILMLLLKNPGKVLNYCIYKADIFSRQSWLWYLIIPGIGLAFKMSSGT